MQKSIAVLFHFLPYSKPSKIFSNPNQFTTKYWNVFIHIFAGARMEIVRTILTGLAVGTIAKFLMPGKDPEGFILTILLVLPVHFFLLPWVNLQVYIKREKWLDLLVQ